MTVLPIPPDTALSSTSREVPSNSPSNAESLVAVLDGAESGSGSRAEINDFPVPTSLLTRAEFIWNEDLAPVDNYAAIGQILAASLDVFRMSQYGSGLFLASSNPRIPAKPITKASELASLLADRLRVRVIKGGKVKGGTIPFQHQQIMLTSESFLQQFKPIDRVETRSTYLADFRLTKPGFNDGGYGQRILHIGAEPHIERKLEAIPAFLDAMAFQGAADRTNALAGALTVLLANAFPGENPLIFVTATKSHAGKDTVIKFIFGHTPHVSISFESTNWALEKSFVAAYKHNPKIGGMVVENVRLGKGEGEIASAFLERFLTDPAPLLYSPGTGTPLQIRNNLILAMSTNAGQLGEDLMNRALPILLAPVGNVADRESAIGNPKLEFLPCHRDRIEGELFGLIENWKEAGMPLDTSIRHPFLRWAQVLGGILKVNGLADFLANYSLRRTADDPVRKAIGLLGAELPGAWHPPAKWATLAADLGLVKQLIPSHEQDSPRGRERGIGVVLSRHRDETFIVDTDTGQFHMTLKKCRRRWAAGEEPKIKYQFLLNAKTCLPEDPENLLCNPTC